MGKIVYKPDEIKRFTATSKILIFSEELTPKPWICYGCGEPLGAVFDLVCDQHQVSFAYCEKCWETAFKQLDCLNFPRVSQDGTFSTPIAKHGLAMFVPSDRWARAENKEEFMVSVPVLMTQASPQHPQMLY